MSNDVVIRTGKHLQIGDEQLEIIDRHDGVHFVDLVTEAKHMNGIVYLSMGSGIADFGNSPVVEVSTRIRMSLVTAQNLKGMLETTINEALKPVDQSKAN